MNPTDISNLRLINQQIAVSKYKTAKDVVAYMGAMQAQDFNMAKWAIGIRLPATTEKQIDAAINKGEIIRTHLLRPTWHLVSSDDIHWMLDLTAPQIRRVIKPRDKDLNLTEAIYSKAFAIIEKKLGGGIHLSREELITEFVRADIAVDNNRASHLFLRAEIDGIICSGKIKANKQTYALLHERIPKTQTLKRDEALAQLALRYFRSHCPATLQDFVWWSGLSVSESNRALEMVKSDFVSETIGNQTYWFPNSFAVSQIATDKIHLVPAYDEFLISYKDRTASLPFKDNIKAVSNNGIFRPVIVHNGQVIGIWKRTIQKDKIIVETSFFQPYNKPIRDLIEKEAMAVGSFLDKKAVIKHSIE